MGQDALVEHQDASRLMRFFYDGAAYDFDGKQAHERDQDLLLPDGRVLIVGKWSPVKKFSYSDEVDHYRPTNLRERKAPPVIPPLEEAARANNLALVYEATFTPSTTVFEPKTYLYADYGEVEELIRQAFGRSDYTIAEGWGNMSFHSYDLSAWGMEGYEGYGRDQVLAYLEKSGHMPDLRWLLCECVLRGIIQQGEYLIYCSW